MDDQKIMQSNSAKETRPAKRRGGRPTVVPAAGHEVAGLLFRARKRQTGGTAEMSLL